MELSISVLFVKLTMCVACVYTVGIWCCVQNVLFCFQQAVHAHCHSLAHQCTLPFGVRHDVVVRLFRNVTLRLALLAWVGSVLWFNDIHSRGMSL